jgi:hypothetical protein
MSSAKKIIRRELDRLKKALDKVIKPSGKDSLPQWAMQPARPRPENPYKK